MKKSRKILDSGVQGKRGTSEACESEGYSTLNPRNKDDPMRLHLKVMEELDHYFLKRELTYLSGQREMLGEALKSIFSATPGTTTVIPLVPGGGKSTLIRALLTVLSKEFHDDTPIAKRLGGVIVVVEKTAEGYELKELCNRNVDSPVAAVLEAPNDYNLAQGKCFNGTATSYETCRRKSCPDCDNCPLMRAGELLNVTPILILFHARYERYMEDMSPLLFWHDAEGEERPRTLLLIDEKPNLYIENKINLELLHAAEKELDSYGGIYSKFPSRRFLYRWSYLIRTPFSKLLRNAPKKQGIFTQEDLESAGFKSGQLIELQKDLSAHSEDLIAQNVIRLFLESRELYFSLGRADTVYLPYLRELNKESSLSTFIFSGAATLSPELAANPQIVLQQTQLNESYGRLHIYVQRGEDFSISKTGLSSKCNFSAAVEWVKNQLHELCKHHRKILLVTYQVHATSMWNALTEYHNMLIPYLNGAGEPELKLPYFGGLNGSNQYQEATCVICLGLHRFEPMDYLSRAIATDFDGSVMEAVRNSATEERACALEQLSCVMAMQDICLAQDIVQLVFRSALRRHGEDVSIELWLLQPPNAVIGHLEEYFKECQISEILEMPEVCKNAVAKAKEYKGKPTHAARLLEWLDSWEGEPVTPEIIRQETGLNQTQFKEARRHPQVQSFFENKITTRGTGKNTVYYKNGGNSYVIQSA